MVHFKITAARASLNIQNKTWNFDVFSEIWVVEAMVE
jgi:hypothetical protein